MIPAHYRSTSVQFQHVCIHSAASASPFLLGCGETDYISAIRTGCNAGRQGRSPAGGSNFRSLVSASRPALARILIGDATDPVCESVFRGRGHEVDFRPGLSKVTDLTET